MIRSLFVVLIFMVALPAAAATPPALTAVLNSFVQTCSATDSAGFSAVFTNAPSITDDLAPFHWQGKDSPAHYIDSLKGAIKDSGWDKFALAASGAPTVDMAGKTAYATVPLFVNYVKKGKPTQDAGIFTLSLKMAAGAWKISSATWTYTKQSP